MNGSFDSPIVIETDSDSSNCSSFSEIEAVDVLESPPKQSLTKNRFVYMYYINVCAHIHEGRWMQ